MRLFITLFILSISFYAQAQTVEKITGSDALVMIQGSEHLLVGDKVNFLNDELNVSGQGEVTKISGGEKKALVKIVSGNAKSGMSLEKTSGTPKTNAVVIAEKIMVNTWTKRLAESCASEKSAQQHM